MLTDFWNGVEGSIMNASRHREIACAIIIDTSGRFLLQQRDDVVSILHPGKVGLFGGHREGDETFLECVVREIYEEISYFVLAERFEYLVSLAGGTLTPKAAPSAPSFSLLAIFRWKG